MTGRHDRTLDNVTRIAAILAALLLVFALLYAFTGR